MKAAKPQGEPTPQQPTKKSPKQMLERFEQVAEKSKLSTSGDSSINQGDDCPVLKGMVFSVLGRKFNKSRNEIHNIIVNNGGKVVEKVTNKVR